MCKTLGFILFFFPCFSFAQETHNTIQTDRPGQAINTNTVGKKVFQFQQGFDFTGSRKTKGFVTEHVVKYGILHNFELSALLSYQLDKTPSEISIHGLSSLQFGFRIQLSKQKNAVPSSSFQLRLKIPNISKNYGTKHMVPTAIYSVGYALPKNMSITANFILDFDGNDFSPIGGYIVNFSFPLHKKLSGFIENYGNLKSTIFQTRIDGGIAYLVSSNVQLDLIGGYGYNQKKEDYFASFGISWRLPFQSLHKKPTR